MTTPSRFPIGRLAAEFAIIVVGVLVALVLESWWSDRAERRFEAELRQDMVGEFSENVAILESDLARNDTLTRSVADFWNMSDSAFLALPDREFQARVLEAMGGATFDPAMGSVQALVLSGNLNAIRDRELRFLIARWAGLLAEGSRISEGYNHALFATLYPRYFDYLADGRWTVDERRASRELVSAMQSIALLEVRVQERLLETAREIVRYLGGPAD